MTLKTDHGSFEIRDLTFADRRKLHRMELNAIDLNTNEINHEKFYDLLEWVMNFAFDNPEEQFAKLDDNQIDEILIAAYNFYKEGVSKKKS
ncbi:MAG TPA: hypothetical protein DG048_11735 [Pseudoalteromonas sp.]|nr:hypothetical protein [Pseudoalteromonas sp.]|tara:strand:+ start:386 stop:658 length:273 start_codon:yes stop_codon:yes gene_type:complete